MSVATPFRYQKTFANFGACITETVRNQTTVGGAASIYGLTLAEAMAWYWNLESLQLDISFNVSWDDAGANTLTSACSASFVYDRKWLTVSTSVVVPPRSRVCRQSVISAAFSGDSPVFTSNAYSQSFDPTTADAHGTFFLHSDHIKTDPNDGTYWFGGHTGNLCHARVSGSAAAGPTISMVHDTSATDLVATTTATAGGGTLPFYLYVNSSVSVINSVSFSVTATPTFYTY